MCAQESSEAAQHLPASPDQSDLKADSESFPVVGIGASAGGLEACTELLKHLPADGGMAYVLVQHLAPQHDSLLSDLLSRNTKMPVHQVEDGMVVRRDHVYVIPPNRDMTISAGILRLVPRPPGHGPHQAIDYFLSSLAEERKSKAIAVILSGSSSDGTLGLKAIKAEGGITFAQDEGSARFSSMPKSAADAGYVDFVLPPAEIAAELGRIGQHPYLSRGKAVEPERALPDEDREFKQIFVLLRAASGADFSQYKKATMLRRIHRRMVLRNIESTAAYVTYLRDNRSEVLSLYHDILIGVTSFFREAEAFEVLQKVVFPELVKAKTADDALRIWVPGCSTGEEPYSIVMCLLEFLEEAKKTVRVQVFASDISEAALQKARTGRYAEGDISDVPKARLGRFFTKVEGGYEINKPVRELCIFAKHDVIKDPPFSRLDLLSCRNLLIYLDTDLQKKLMPIFNYALRPHGFLLLGKSEGISEFSELFIPVDKKNRIYSRHATVDARLEAVGAELYRNASEALAVKESRPSGEFDIVKEAGRVLLADYTPPGVIVNGDLEILHFHGRVSPYLDHSSGPPSFRLLRWAGGGLPLELRSAIHQAEEEQRTVIKRDIQIQSSDGEARAVGIEVRPFRNPSSSQAYFLILFRESGTPQAEAVEPASTGQKPAEPDREGLRVQEELQRTRAEMQRVVEEQEAGNEELRAANEEIQSSNEELQSTNEELETAKEELQATNEELATINEELHSRNTELTQANNDLTNVIGNVTVPLVILDNDLRIRRYTPPAEGLLSLIPADVGRPVTDLRSAIDFPGLEELVTESVKTGTTQEHEVTDRTGRWYSLRVRPYNTAEKRTDSAVVTFIDIDALKREVNESRAYAEAIVETVRESLLVLDTNLMVKAANRSFYENFRVSPSETENTPLYELGNGQWNIPRLRAALTEIVPKKFILTDFEVEHEFPQIGLRTMLLNARQVRSSTFGDLTLLAIEDVSKRKQHEMEIRLLSGRLLRAQDEERRRIARELHDNTAQTLAALAMRTFALQRRLDTLADPELSRAISDIKANADEAFKGVRNLSHLLHPPDLEISGLYSAVRWYVETFTELTGIQVEIFLPTETARLPDDVELALFRILQESLTNIQRHSGSQTATVRILREPRQAILEVQDQGKGMRPETLQMNGARLAGTGLGLTGMRLRVKQIGGNLEIISDGRAPGTTVRVVVPVPAESPVTHNESSE
jgi:two-component system, chemotaxis family, CheB/CheR fusion protein